MRRRKVKFLFAVAKEKLEKSGNKKKKTVNDSQKIRKIKKQTYLAVWALSTLLLLLGIGKLFVFLSSLDRPKSITISSSRGYSWGGNHSINLVVKSKTIQLINLNPVDNKLTIVDVPDEAYIEVPKGYGFWKAGSIFELGQGENPPVGPQLLKLSLSKLFGLPIDGVILLENSNDIRSLGRGWFSLLSNLSNIESDMTTFETIRVLRKISPVRADKTYFLDLKHSSITVSKLLPDTTRVLGVDTIKADLFFRQHLKDAYISNSDLSIGIFNGTNHPGLAQQVSRMITNLGGNVITVSNADQTLGQSRVYTADNLSKQNQSVERITQLFAASCLKDKCVSTDPKVNASRAQINIVVGEDFFKKFYERNSIF